MPTRTRKTPLKRNKRDWFPKQIGYLDRAKKKPTKFNLGTDETRSHQLSD